MLVLQCSQSSVHMESVGCCHVNSKAACFTNVPPEHVALTSNVSIAGRPRLKCDGTRAETRFRLSPKRTSPFKSAGASVQSTTGSRGVRISGSNAGYTMF